METALDSKARRRAGELDMLADALTNWDVSIDDYVEAIERSAGRSPGELSISERLTDVDDVSFDGDDEANIPGDRENFRSSHEIENEVVDQFAHTLETGMVEDVPEDILRMFNAIHQPMFSDWTAYVQGDRLDEMIEALESRGYTIVHE